VVFDTSSAVCLLRFFKENESNILISIKLS
jgi:hypothetical protein